jgi:hypothetical protein
MSKGELLRRLFHSAHAARVHTKVQHHRLHPRRAVAVDAELSRHLERGLSMVPPLRRPAQARPTLALSGRSTRCTLKSAWRSRATAAIRDGEAPCW